MALNGVLITNSENTYPYRAMLETLLTYGPDAQKCRYLECCLFASDTPGHMDATTGDDNRGLKHRRNASARSQTMDLMGLIREDITQAVPHHRANPVLEPQIPTQLAAPAAKAFSRVTPPVGGQVNSVGATNQPRQQPETEGASRDSCAQLNPSVFGTGNSDRNRGDSEVLSQKQGLFSNSVTNLEKGNDRQEPEEEAERSQNVSRLNFAAGAHTGTAATDTDAHDASLGAFSKSGFPKEAEKKEERVVQAQDALHGDGYKTVQDAPHGDRYKTAQDTLHGDGYKTAQDAPHGDRYKTAQDALHGDGYKTTHDTPVQASYRDHTTTTTTASLSRVQNDPPIARSGVSDSRPPSRTEHVAENVPDSVNTVTTWQSPEDRENVPDTSDSINTMMTSQSSEPRENVPDTSDSINTITTSPSPEHRENVPGSINAITRSSSSVLSATPAENVSPERNDGLSTLVKGEVFVAGDMILEGGESTVDTTQQASSTSPDLASYEETQDMGGLPLQGVDDEIDGDDMGQFRPDKHGHAEPPTRADIPEKVVNIEDVEERQRKRINGPKDGIILYTALIIVLIASIIFFSLWKNASKKGRHRNPMSINPTGEEGKRLLDHPFV
ncbi:hypothetical protein ACOMHN_051626 [Nucella lapillus]